MQSFSNRVERDGDEKGRRSKEEFGEGERDGGGKRFDAEEPRDDNRGRVIGERKLDPFEDSGNEEMRMAVGRTESAFYFEYRLDRVE